MFDSQRYIRFPPKWIWSLQGLQQSLSLGIDPIDQCWAVFPTWQYCRWSFVWWMYAIKRARRLSQALVHFVTALASLFTDQRMSSPPIRAKYKHFKNTIWAHTFDSSPTWFQFLLSLEAMIIQAKELRLCPTALSFCLPAHNIFQRTFIHDLPCRKTTRQFLREASATVSISQLLQQKNSWFELFLWTRQW